MFHRRAKRRVRRRQCELKSAAFRFSFVFEHLPRIGWRRRRNDARHRLALTLVAKVQERHQHEGKRGKARG
jgi:hypothetical protein